MSTVSDSTIQSALTEDEFRALGINSVPVVRYEWGGFRYTNLSDAVAAATRAAK
jgi:hypothetical protein